ncbi:MAG TPA: OsmC family protein [Acidimicrobiales bacterium]|nr:OsmC family protein [Acidimicrobiales bacterium]
MDLRELQRPLKQRYRAEPASALLTLRASASQQDSPMACSVDIGRAIYEAQAHSGVGGPGTAACSGDLLLGALAACAQVTYQMVSTAMGVPVASVEVTVEGDLDLRGTLGIDPEAPVGFSAIRLAFEVDAPDASPEQLASVLEKTERYCVVLQTLTTPPAVTVEPG